MAVSEAETRLPKPRVYVFKYIWSHTASGPAQPDTLLVSPSFTTIPDGTGLVVWYPWFTSSYRIAIRGDPLEFLHGDSFFVFLDGAVTFRCLVFHVALVLFGWWHAGDHWYRMGELCNHRPVFCFVFEVLKSSLQPEIFIVGDVQQNSWWLCVDLCGFTPKCGVPKRPSSVSHYTTKKVR